MKITNAVKSFFGFPTYARLSDGTHTYNLEMSRGLFSMFGSKKYFRLKDNYLDYYEEIPFLATCVDLIADTVASVNIKEVGDNGDDLGETDFIKLLNNPNKLQDRMSFLKESAIHILVNGLNVQYLNTSNRKRIDSSSEIYNLQFNRLMFPEIKDRYILTSWIYSSLPVLEDLEEGVKRDYTMNEILFIYDSLPYSMKRENYSKTYFLPHSRVTSLAYQLQTLTNISDSRAYLTTAPVLGVLSKKNGNNIVPLGGAEKADIETKVNGLGKYGAGLGKTGGIIAANEELSYLSLLTDSAKLNYNNYENMAKEAVKQRYNIPNDLIDTKERGSTYENQQYAEARFAKLICASISDRILNGYMNKYNWYFQSRGTKLVGDYNHLPSIIAVDGVERNDGLVKKTTALKNLLDAYEKAKLLGVSMDLEEFMKKNGFDDLI